MGFPFWLFYCSPPGVRVMGMGGNTYQAALNEDLRPFADASLRSSPPHQYYYLVPFCAANSLSC